MAVTGKTPFYTSIPPYYMSGFWTIVCLFPYLYYKDKNNVLFLTPIVLIVVFHLFFWWKRVKFYDNHIEFLYPFRPFKRKKIIQYENIQSIFVASGYDFAGAPFKINVIEKEEGINEGQMKKYTFPFTGFYKNKEWQLIVDLRNKGIIITDNYFNGQPPNRKRITRIHLALGTVYLTVVTLLILLLLKDIGKF